MSKVKVSVRFPQCGTAQCSHCRPVSATISRASAPTAASAVFSAQEMGSNYYNQSSSSKGKRLNCQKVINEFDLKSQYVQRQLSLYHDNKSTMISPQSTRKQSQHALNQRENRPATLECDSGLASEFKNRNALNNSHQHQRTLHLSPTATQQSPCHKVVAKNCHCKGSRQQLLSQRYACECRCQWDHMQQHQGLNTAAAAYVAQMCERSQTLLSSVYQFYSPSQSSVQQSLDAELSKRRRTPNNQIESDFTRQTQVRSSENHTRKAAIKAKKSQHNYSAQKSVRSVRPEITEDEFAIGAGSYAAERKFGDDTRSYTISRLHREGRIELTPGPGFYNPDIKLTKNSAVEVRIREKQPSQLEASPKEIIGPGSYPEHRNFGKNLPNQTIGTRRERSIEKSVGPGDYRPEIGDGLVRPKSQQVLIRQSLSPRDRSADDLIGPGKYYGLHDFSKDTRKVKINPRRPEKTPDKSPGPGDYTIDNAEKYTKYQAQAIDFANQKGRDTVLPDATIGPGSYHNTKGDFGRDLNKITIGERRQDKKNESQLGPGQYNPHRADSLTKFQASAVDFSNQTGRVDKAEEDLVGPTSYQGEQQLQFGRNLNNMTIGERRPTKEPESVGPGRYNVDRADKTTKPSSRTVNFADQTGRVDREESTLVGPGEYHQMEDFDKDTRRVTIRCRQPEKSPDQQPGPGDYQHDIAAKLVKYNAPAIDFKNKAGRKSKVDNDTVGPGSYYREIQFGADARKVTIATKREEQIREPNPGPADYNHSNSVKLIKPQSQAIDFAHMTGRVTQELESDIGPGHYEKQDFVKFGQDATKITIGERRPEKMPESIGPGHYNLETADRQVKHRPPVVGFENQTGRNEAEVLSDLGPGKYHITRDFDFDSHKMTIGTRKIEKTPEQTPGPADYDRDTAERHTNHRAPSIDFERQVGRVEKQIDDKVGPGFYHQDRQFGSDAQKFTIGVKHPETATDSKPGPGYYTGNIDVTRPKAPQVQFSKVSEFQTTEVSPGKVGPGTYDPHFEFGNNLGPMTIGERRYVKEDTEKPGPGSYEIAEADDKVRHSNRAVNFQAQTGRTERDNHSQIGPGDYYEEKKFGEDARKVTIGTRQADRTPERGPGPCSYEIEAADKHTKHRVQSIDFEKLVKRTEPKVDNRVGPGDYHQEREFGADSQKVTIRVKHPESKPDQKPGPGDYDREAAEKHTNYRAQAIDFEKQTGRIDKIVDDSVGPGLYHFDKQFGSDAKQFTIGIKHPETKPDSKPGPGDYDKDAAERHTRHEARAVDFQKQSERQEPKVDLSTGGPVAYYEQKEFGADGIKFTIGVRHYSQTKPDSNLGPGAYNQNIDSVRPLARSVAIRGIDSDQRDNQQENPGPGQYEVSKIFGRDTNQMTIGERRPEREHNRIPGPGAYDPQIADKHVKVAARASDFEHQSKRKERVSDHVVAPGDYELQSEFAIRQQQMTMGAKRAQKVEVTVGPGEYDHALGLDKIKHTSPQVDFSHQAGRKESKVDSQLGPGQYLGTSEFSGGLKNVTLGERREQRQCDTIGPGQYDPQVADYAVRYSQPSFSFSNQARGGTDLRQETVGPGNYDVAYEFGSDSRPMTIGRKYPDRAAVGSNTGPGSYSPERADQLTKVKCAEIDFSSRSERKTVQIDQRPGPGSYEDRTFEFGRNLPQQTIGEKRLQARSDMSVGPGHYDERVDATRHRAPEVDFQMSRGRDQNLPAYQSPPKQQTVADVGEERTQTNSFVRVEDKRNPSGTKSLQQTLYDKYYARLIDDATRIDEKVPPSRRISSNEKELLSTPPKALRRTAGTTRKQTHTSVFKKAQTSKLQQQLQAIDEEKELSVQERQLKYIRQIKRDLGYSSGKKTSEVKPVLQRLS